MSNIGHIKKMRSDKAKKLKREHTAAFLVLDTVAENAKRKRGEGHVLLELGEAIITAEECGITKNQLPTALIYLEDEGFIEVIHRGRKDKNSKLEKRTRIKPESPDAKSRIKSRINGTVVKLIDTELYDINIEDDQNQNQNQTRITQRKNQNKEERKNKELKEDHHPYPSSKVLSIGDAETDGLTDDFPSAERANTRQRSSAVAAAIAPVQNQHNINYQAQVADIEIYPNVFLTQKDLDACIKIKGSRESVEYAIAYIQKHPNRKHEITDWVNALLTWQIKDSNKPRVKENEELAQKLSTRFHSFDIRKDFMCRITHDRKKDQRGLLIESPSQSAFIAFVDPEFRVKVDNFFNFKNIEI